MLETSIATLGKLHLDNDNYDLNNDTTDAIKLMLASYVNINCYTEEQLIVFKSIIQEFTTHYFPGDCYFNDESDLVNVVSDDMVGYFTKYPQCMTFAQWERVANGLSKYYKIDYSVTVNKEKVLELVTNTSSISETTVPEIVYKVTKDIKESKVTSTTVISDYKVNSEFNQDSEYYKNLNLNLGFYKKLRTLGVSQNVINLVYSSGLSFTVSGEKVTVCTISGTYTIEEDIIFKDL